MPYNPSMTQNPGESQDQTYQRYNKDYWAPDRNQVLGTGGQPPNTTQNPAPPQNAFPDPNAGQQPAWNPNAVGQPGVPQDSSGPFNGQSFYGKTDPASITSYVQGMLKGTGREGDQQMWVNYITKAGGGPNGFWDEHLKANSGGDAGGGGGINATSGRGGGAYVPGQGAPGQGTIFGAQGGNPRSNALEDLLMKRAGQNIVPSANDPVIKAQTDAFGAIQTRGARQSEAVAAERAGPNTNASAVTRSADENAALNTSNFEGQAMQRELDSRRQEVQAALSGAQGMLTAEEQMQLQEELAQLQIAQGSYQFDTQQQYLNSPMNPNYVG